MNEAPKEAKKQPLRNSSVVSAQLAPSASTLPLHMLHQVETQQEEELPANTEPVAP